MEHRIRLLRKDEFGELDNFLYEAIFVPEGVSPPTRKILFQPELQVYVRDFGTRRGDVAFAAESGGKVVGAAWSRIMNDYGHINDDTPSLAISLYKGNTAQSPPEGFVLYMLAYFPSSCTEIP